MRTRRAMAAGLAALSVAATACGTQVSAGVRERAAASLLGGGGGGGLGGPGAAGSDAGAAGTGTSGAGGAGTGAVTGVGGGSAAGASGGSGGGRAAAAAGPTAGAGGEDASGGGCSAGSGTGVGLTPQTVTVGSVVDLSGPVPGLFEGAAEGMQAFASYVDSTGGICGRQLKVQVADSGTDCGQNQSDTQQLLNKVFGFVGSFSLYDDCGAKVLGEHPDVADIHVPLSVAAGQIPNNVSPGPHPPGSPNGMYAYYAKKFGDKVRNVGTLYGNIPSAAQSAAWVNHAAESAGWRFTYQRAYAATETDWTSDFVKMCQQKHIQIFFVYAVPANAAATMVLDEQKAGCAKDLVNIVSSVGYDQSFIPDLGGASEAEGILGFNGYSLFFNTDEAQRVPEVALFQQWFKRVYPDKALNLYAMYSWADGRLFEQALKAVGPRAGRTAVMAALHDIHRFDANGLLAPADPNSKSAGATCYVLWQIHDGRYERVDTPATGYRCDGSYVPYQG